MRTMLIAASAVLILTTASFADQVVNGTRYPDSATASQISLDQAQKRILFVATTDSDPSIRSSLVREAEHGQD